MVDQKLKSLRELTADNPIQQQRLTAIGASGFQQVRRIAGNHRPAEGQKGLDQPSRWLSTDRGKNAMDSIRKLVGEMQEEETGYWPSGPRRRKTVRTHRDDHHVGRSVLVRASEPGGVFLTRNIAVPLGEVSAAAQKIASGDLSVSVLSNGRRDEVGILAAELHGDDGIAGTNGAQWPNRSLTAILRSR